MTQRSRNPPRTEGLSPSTSRLVGSFPPSCNIVYPTNTLVFNLAP